MGLFDNILSSDQTLIRYEEALDYEFMPKILKYREQEQQYIATAIKPLFAGRSGKNLLIHGSPGIGKTLATKHVLQELGEKTDEIETIFVNCWQHNTSYKIFVEICEQLGYHFTQNKKTTELQKIALRLLNKQPVVLVFDEIDKADDKDFLYVLVEGVYHKTILLLTNYKSLLFEVDERIRSRLTPELVEFKEYSLAETTGILQERIDVALVPNCLEAQALKEICSKTTTIKDIRSGLFLIKNSAINAEEKSSKTITLEHVQEAVQQLDEFSSKREEELDEDLQFILNIVKEESGKKIGDLYKTYETTGGSASYKTFQRKIAKLQEGRYIKVTKQTGAGGNTSIVEKKLTDY